MSQRTTKRLRHNMIELALHELRPGGNGARPLLLVHGLGEATPTAAPAWAASWPGAVFGLDLTGHGESDVPAGGGYTPEVLMADVDTAVATLGPSTLVGRGLGAYLCLLLAGGRPGVVRGAVLADGPGLAGGTTGPPSPTVVTVPAAEEGTAPDPWALAELTRDVRPRDYAVTFARSAVQQSGLETPIVVTARYRPPWLQAVAAEPGVVEDTIESALTRLA
jgi:pimeloyl-ACP methyl ester carboxylesterase